MKDRETEKIMKEQKLLKDLIGHEGWPLVRAIFADRIMQLQNAFDIDTATPTTMFRDLQARKKASEILFDILRAIEGVKDVVEYKQPEKPYLVNLDRTSA